MYCDFFGLRFRPFEDRADTRLFHPTGACEEALAMMEYECHYGKGMALLLGEAGTGKTLLVRMLLQRLHATDHVVVLTWPSAAQTDLFRETSKAFGVTLPSSQHQSRSVARLRRHLIRNIGADHRSILVVDQAENLTPENLAQLAMLSELNCDDKKLLNVILVGQPQIRNLLERPEAARIRQQLYGERVLPPLTRKETIAYVSHRLQVAGAAESAFFEPDALELVYEASNGLPRLINHICNAAMLAAYGAEESSVTRSFVSEVAPAGLPSERSIEVSELGLRSSDQVAAGWTSESASETPVGSDEATEALPPTPVVDELVEDTVFDSVVEECEGPPAALPASDSVMPIGSSSRSSSMFLRGETLLGRLERALARAERMDTTINASLSQHAAVERHLGTLVDQAGRLVKGLPDQTQHATRYAEEFERRIARAKRDSEARSADIDAQMTRIADIADEAQVHLDGLEQASADAGQTRSKLTLSAEQLADKADEVQARIADLMSGLEMSESARERLQVLLNEEASVASRAEGKLNEFRGGLEDACAEARRQEEKAIEIERSRVGRVAQLAASVVNDAEKSVAELQATASGRFEEQMRAIIRGHEELASQEIEKHRAAARAMLDESESRYRALEGAITAGREKAEVTLALQRKAADETHDEFAARIRHQVEAQEEVARRTIEEHRTSFQLLLDESESQYRALAQTISASREKAEVTLALHQKATGETLDRFAVRMRRQQQELSTMEQRHPVLARSVKELDGQLGASLARTQHLAKTVHDVESKFNGLATRGQRAVSGLSTALSQGESLLENVHNACGQVEAMQRTVATTLAEVGGASERLSALHDEASRGEQAVAKLTLERESGVAVASQLEDLVGCATQLHEAMQGTIAHTDEKMGRLTSHHAATTHVLGELNEVTRNSHVLVEKIAPLIEQAQALEEQTDFRTKALAESSRNAAALIESVAAVTAPAEEVNTELARHFEQAQRLDRAMVERCDEAGGLVERLETVATTLGEVDATQAQMTEVTEQAVAVHRELMASSETAERQNAALEEQRATVEQAKETCSRIRTDTETAVGRLAEQLASAERALETHEPLITGLHTQTNAVEGRLRELKITTEGVEQKLCELTERPAEIMEGAQAQAEQLEAVCSAVRKIFASLSQATLDAHKQTEEAQKSSREAMEQLAQSSSETQHAAHTLNEWVAEAVNVQARLERTLQQCPSIRETHPAETLRRMSVMSVPRPAKSIAAGELAVLTEPGKEDAPAGETSQKPQSRAQEIASLLEEAKRATAASPG